MCSARACAEAYVPHTRAKMLVSTAYYMVVSNSKCVVIVTFLLETSNQSTCVCWNAGNTHTRALGRAHCTCMDVFGKSIGERHTVRKNNMRGQRKQTTTLYVILPNHTFKLPTCS